MIGSRIPQIAFASSSAAGRIKIILVFCHDCAAKTAPATADGVLSPRQSFQMFSVSSTFLVLPRKYAATRVANHSAITGRVFEVSRVDYYVSRGGVSIEN